MDGTIDLSKDVNLFLGDCREILPRIPDGSVDAVICDPPYPFIKREYGYWDDVEWNLLMDSVIAECRRVLKATGSAVFVLQPNGEKSGHVRSWFWDFLAKWTKEWNMVQDIWWFNDTVLPTGGCTTKGLTRSAMKICAWLGDSDCYRCQDDILIEISKRHHSRMKRFIGIDSKEKEFFPSGQNVDQAKACKAAREKGGTTPFNLIITNHGAGQDSAGAFNHGAGTPYDLCDWWVRYITPKGGFVLDPFAGSGTVLLAALNRSRRVIGIEKTPEYFDIMKHRIERPHDKTPRYKKEKPVGPLFRDLEDEEDEPDDEPSSEPDDGQNPE